MNKLFRYVNPRSTMATYIPIVVILAICGALFTEFGTFTIVFWSAFIALPLNAAVAGFIAHRNIMKG